MCNFRNSLFHTEPGESVNMVNPSYQRTGDIQQERLYNALFDKTEKCCGDNWINASLHWLYVSLETFRDLEGI